MKRGITLLCLVLLLLFFAGCGKSEQTSKLEIKQETTVTQVDGKRGLDSELIGTWRRIADENYKGSGITFFGDGSYKFYHLEYNDVLSEGIWYTQKSQTGVKILTLDNNESWEYMTLPDRLLLTSRLASTLWVPEAEGEEMEKIEDTVKQNEDTTLLGTWRSSGGGILITFKEDGTLRYENIGNPIQKAKWTVDNDIVTLVFPNQTTTYNFTVKDEVLYLEVDGETSKWYR